jgi:hypothetical protein
MTIYLVFFYGNFLQAFRNLSDANIYVDAHCEGGSFEQYNIVPADLRWNFTFP